MQSPPKRKRSRFLWTEALQNVLLDIWRENSLDLRRAKHNGHIYRNMAEQIKTVSGTTVTVKEITIKIKNLTRKYREEKAIMEASGGSPSSWPLFEVTHQILGGFPSKNFEVEEILPECDLAAAAAVTPPSLSPTPSTSLRKRKRNFTDILLEQFSRSNSDTKKLFEESNHLMRQANNLLERSVRCEELLLQQFLKE